MIPAPTPNSTMLHPVNSNGPLGYWLKFRILSVVVSSETVDWECSCASQQGNVSIIPPTPAKAAAENCTTCFHSRRSMR